MFDCLNGLSVNKLVIAATTTNTDIANTSPIQTSLFN